jgi:hypothetical protein
MTDNNPLVATLLSMLAGQFDHVSVNEFGNVLIPLPDNPVVWKAKTAIDASPVVQIESPVLLDVPAPRPSVLRYLLTRSHDLGFGRLAAVFGPLEPEPTGDPPIVVQAQLLADTLAPAALGSAIRIVHATSLGEIAFFRQLSPPVGGTRAYESSERR